MRWGAVVGLMFALLLGAAPSAVAQPFGLAPGASPYSGPQHHMTLRRAGNELRLLDGGRTVLRRHASAAGRLVVNGTAGNDTLRVDFAGGDPAPHGLLFDGGLQAGGTGDALELTGGRFERAVVTFTPDRPGRGHDGRIVLDGKAIEFRDLEPLLINAGTPADVVFNIPEGDGDNQTVLENDTGGMATMSQLRSGAGTFETTTFTHPASSLTINLGNDATESLSITDDSVAAPIAVNGGSGANDLVLANGETLVGGQFNGAGGIDGISYAAYSAGVAANLGANAGLVASLTADQEQPATSSTASGTATLLYDNVAKNFDVNVAVSGLPAANVTGFHIHGAPVGVNGSVRVDFGAGSVVSDGSGGFTFSANDVALPPDLEAALLGGATYLNVHTAAFPSGAIRGQLFASVNYADAVGTATGTGGVSNVENVTGGAGADSLVGNNVANSILGGGGNDTILPARGGDTASGQGDNDVLIWSNGDGSDVLNGDAGTDRVQVNGAAGGTGDAFALAANGTRLDFQRTTPGPFSLDIGTVETLSAVGREDSDNLAINSLAGVADLTKVELHGLSGDDLLTAATLPAGIAGQLRGQAGNDFLTAPGGAWQITGQNAGTLTGVMSFDTTENLTTGVSDDSFALADGAGLSGTLDAGTGLDTLNYGSYTTGVRANLGSNAPSLTATLAADQEVPATNSPASGTAALTYNPQTGLFAIDVDVDNLDTSTITGFHIHSAPIGVNGSIIVDLMALLPPGGFPPGIGFTYSATGVGLPALQEAALLGGATYVNIHTGTLPTGAIRGQLLPSAASVADPPIATGFGTIASIDNVTGGGAADSLVGSTAANVIAGGGGADTIVPGRGADAASGDASDDVLVWNDGDGTDILDGAAGADRIQVNGSAGATGDVFTAAANGVRVAFARTAPGPFGLDIGTVERIAVAGNAGDDSLTSSNLDGVADLIELSLHGLAGNDSLAYTAGSAAISGLLRGGAGNDTLTVNGVPGTANETFTVGSGAAGRVSVARTAPTTSGAEADRAESVVADGGDGADALTIGDLAGVPTVTSASLRGGAGADLFTAVPSATVATSLQGGSEDDTLNFDGGCLALTAVAGQLSAAGRQPVTYSEIENLSVASAIRFAAASGSYSEAAGTAAIGVTRTGIGSASSQYATSPLTALAGSDYSTLAGTLNFASNATTGTISVPLADDTAIEGDETFRVDLQTPSAFAHVCAPTQFTATITDNDGVTPPPPGPPPAVVPPPAAPPPAVPPPPPPSTTAKFAITGIVASSRTGTARVTMRLPRRGNVSITARSAGVRVSVARASARNRAAGTLRVTLRTTATGRRLLRSRGRLRVTLTGTFTPSSGGAKSTSKRSATLRLRRAR